MRLRRFRIILLSPSAWLDTYPIRVYRSTRISRSESDHEWDDRRTRRNNRHAREPATTHRAASRHHRHTHMPQAAKRPGLRHGRRSRTPASTGSSIAATPITSAAAGCRTKFAADPEHTSPANAPAKPPYPRARSTPARCTREIRQVGPGTCPICGMALEPVMVTARQPAQPRTRRHDAPVLDRPRAALPVVALEMGGHLSAAHGFVGQTLSNWIQLAAGDAGRAVGRLAVLRARLGSLRHAQPQHVHADRDGHRRGLALQRRRHRRARPSSPPRSAAMDGAVAVYFEAAAVITVLVLLGQVLELRAREQTRGAIQRAARPCAEDRAPRQRRRHRRRGRARQRRRSATACASGPARRCRSTATSLEGRSSLDESHGDRRVHAGHQGGRRAR